jgi:hypothetical protein
MNKLEMVQVKSGLRSKKSGRKEFSFNVIRFMRTGKGRGESQESRTVDNFKKDDRYFQRRLPRNQRP